MSLQIRKYQPGDEDELRGLYFQTIRSVNLRDYSIEQVSAWASDEYDRQSWRNRITSMSPCICEDQGTIVGYAGLLETGHIDHFYVHHERQGQGIGKLLYATIEAAAIHQQMAELTSDVSITARPFFESRGFHVVTEQEVTLGSVVLPNFKMKKVLEVV